VPDVLSDGDVVGAGAVLHDCGGGYEDRKEFRSGRNFGVGDVCHGGGAPTEEDFFERLESNGALLDM